MAGTSGSIDRNDVITFPAPVLVTVRAQHVLLAAAGVWTPPVAGGLLSVTFVVLTGTATVVDADGTSAGPLPAGMSATWGVEADDDTLTGPQSITAGAGSSVYVNWTERV